VRFERLNIECYGRFGSKVLDLKSANGLVIVYGPNEAGKSTTRTAVTDLLFGVPARTPLMEVFGGNKMAVMADLRLSNGSEVTIRRTKGNANTLRDSSGNILNDAFLQSILNGVTRDRFESLFSLNHETLRLGGDSLLKSNGEIGRMIVSAGGGLSGLNARLKLLEEECAALFTTRRSNTRQFYSELDRYETAQRTLRAAQLTITEYQKNQKHIGELAQLIENTRAQRTAIQSSIAKRERLVRTLPLALELLEQRAAIASYSDLPEPESEFSKQVTEAFQKRKGLEESLMKLDSELTVLREKADKSAFDERLPAHKSAIELVSELAGNVKSALTGRDKRLKELSDSLANLKPLMELLGRRDAEEKDLISLAPTELIRAEAERVAKALRELEQKIALKEESVREAMAKCSQLTGQIETLTREGYDTPSGIDLKELDAAELRTSASKKYQEAERLRQQSLSRSERHGAEAPACFAWRLPAEATVAGEVLRREEISEALRKANQDSARAEERKRKAQRDIDDLRRQGELPSEQDLKEARSLREEAWQSFKEAVLVPAGAIEPESCSELAQVVEVNSAEADRLADLRIREATRAASLQSAQYQLEDAEREILQIKQNVEALQSRLDGLREAWSAAWQEAAAWQPDAVELQKSIRELELARKDWEKAAEAEAEANALSSEVELCLQKLLAAESRLKIQTETSASDEARIVEVRSRCSAHDERYANWKVACGSLETELLVLETRKQDLEDLVTRRQQLSTRWEELMPHLGVPKGASIEDGDRAAKLWAAASGHFDAAHNTRRRLERMEEDREKLAAEVTRLAAATGIAASESAIDTAARLKKALDEAIGLQKERQTCEDLLASKVPERERLIASLDSAVQAVAELCARRACDEEGLRIDSARFDARAKLMAQAAAVEKSLRAAGDNLPIDTLLADVDGQDLDSINASLTELKEKSAACDGELERAVKEQTELALKQRNMLSETAVLEASAEKERAYSALQQTAAEYLYKRAAKELLEAAIDRVRRERQDPLVMRASQLFSRATLGAYYGLTAEPGGKDGEVVVAGCSEERGAISVDKMSDGTRDQLYLAFRVAAVEQYCSSTEPLPFVADDLLVHFDDERSRAALEMLAELGTSTQVLLFTHHIQVRDAARELENLGSATVVELV
jgi:uncharacterized protein YhaN